MRIFLFSLLLMGCGSDDAKGEVDMAMESGDGGEDLFSATEDLPKVLGDLTMSDLTSVDLLPAQKKRIFVTSGTWNGNLKGQVNGAANGLAAADQLCKTAATALGGNWVAWLSDGTTDALSRVTDVGPWYRIDGMMVFANKAALTGNPMVAININENGTVTNFFPWTGTNANGTKNAATCLDWTNATGGNSGECGSSMATGATWTASSALKCNVPYNLYCLEQ